MTIPEPHILAYGWFGFGFISYIVGSILDIIFSPKNLVMTWKDWIECGILGILFGPVTLLIVISSIVERRK